MKKKESWASKLKRNVQMIIHGKNYKAPKKKAGMKTARTSAIEDRLSNSGLTAAEIKKLRGN